MSQRDMGPIFLHGDLGAHCTECADVSVNLCDYPVGEGKTCDRPLCDEHSSQIGNDIHYCRDHFIMWNEYLASQRGYEVLRNVTPIGDNANIMNPDNIPALNPTPNLSIVAPDEPSNFT